jgi:hypothetical protein
MASRVDEITKRPGRNRLFDFLPTDRLNAFADGVFAIVITLLVLELPVPEATEDLLWALLAGWPDFLAYVISFAFIGGFWITHSSVSYSPAGLDHALVHYPVDRPRRRRRRSWRPFFGARRS